VTEIRVDVDLAHPLERVWRTLTEARLVLGWLPTAHFMVTEDNRFTFRAADLDGLDEQVEGHIVTSERPHRLVMRWEAPNLHTLLSVTLQPTADGCRLSLAQRGFLGAHGTMRRRVLHRTYTELLNGPFRAALERLAAEEAREAVVPSRPAEPARARNDGRAFQRLPRQVPPRSASAPGLTSYVRVAAGPKHTATMPGLAAAVLSAASVADRPVGVVPAGEVAKLTEAHQPGRAGRLARGAGRLVAAGWRRMCEVPRSPERRSQAVAAGAAALLLLAMVALLVGRATEVQPPDPPQVGGAAPPPFQASLPAPATARATSPAATGPTAATGSAAPSAAAPSASGSATTRSALTPAKPTLSASYETEEVRLSSYAGAITIHNPTGRTIQDWTIKITLPPLDLRVRDVEGATATTVHNEVTLTPVAATRELGVGASVKVRFQVDGLGQPTACSIDGQPCEGIPE
jgi:uncharacterized protein YndB with AHSA1/START domain